MDSLTRSRRAWLCRAVLVLVAVLTAACSLLPEEIDTTANWSANRLYAEAKSAMDDGNWEEAIKFYQRLESRYPYGRFAQQAQMEVAYAHWKNADSDAALAACDRFIKLHPNHPGVDYLYYLKGLITFNGDLGFMGYFNTQDQTERDPKSTRESFETFRELVRRFPDSKYTPDALQRMSYLVNALSAHEVHVARYYYRRGAYLAAANRSQYAIQHYPGTPAQEEALYLLMLSYEKLGMADLRADAERVLRLNYPDSHFLADGLDRKTPWWRVF
ncbi:MAG: outer membrane protein assembly factor BamD [Zoogloeaceae bacterium]|jgi:outer membrane protein assembly factor BamD|nr:outer membrane protein assembly factor BamD [Zoogloeaceae bacterium]